ncbi:MAG: peptidase M20, partial [Fimbriimonadaceae bacterium]
MIQESRLVDLFKKLCLIDAPAYHEGHCKEFLAGHLTELGLEVWEDEAGDTIGGTCNNVLARLPGNKEGVPGVFFSAHMDTVEPTAGLKIIEREGTLYSDGTTILGADDKAGLAPIIEAVRSVMEDGKPHGDIYLLFSV